MTKISFEEFRKNPVLYVLFLPLIALVALFFMLKEATKEQVLDKNRQIEKAEKRIEKVDSINHVLYETLGQKRIMDTLNSK